MKLEDLLKRLLGTTARAADTVGNAFGNPLPDLGLTERGEAIGAGGMSTPDRIAKSLQNTGAIAEGDYKSATDLGYSPMELPSRATGGILTQPQQASNSSAVDDFFKREGITDRNVNPDLLNPAQRTEYNRITAPTGGNNGGIDFNQMFNEQRSLARSAYDEGVRRAGSAYDRARGLYDEGIGMLGKRRDEFKGLLDTGNQDITQEYQSRGGELGTSAQNRRLTDAAALQAQGFGGSAVERAQNRQSRDEVRGLGTLMQNRDTNKRENQSQYDERLNWADTQERDLNRGLSDAAENRRQAEAQSGLIERGDQAGITNNINSFLQSILSSQQALDTANKGVSGYTANPYAVNIADVSGQLQAQLPSTGGTSTGTNMGANIDEQNKKLALLRKQAGGNMYGLA